MPTAVSVVEKGCAATTVDAPVSALNRLDLPLLGRPTRPRRSTKPRLQAGLREPTCRVEWHASTGRDRRARRPGIVHYPAAAVTEGTMSKKTKKKKLNARRKKANHGKRPNAGRR